MSSDREIASLVHSFLPLAEVDNAEIYLETRQNLEIQVKDREINSLQRAREQGVAVRLEREGHVGFAYSTDLTRGALERLVAQSYNSLQTVEPKYRQYLPDLHMLHSVPTLQQYDEGLATRPLVDKIEVALHLEQVALEYDKRVQQVRMGTYQDEVKEVLLWSCKPEQEPAERHYRSTLCQVYLMVIAADDTGQESSWNIGFAPYFDELPTDAVARDAAEEAVGRLQAQVLKTGHYTAVLDRSVVAAFLGILAPSFLGDAVQKHKSRLEGKLGEAIYADCVNLVDDGCLRGGMASFPYDGEGVPSQKTPVVAKGVLQTYLYDTSSGRTAGKESTGNSVRANIKEAPRAGTRNFYLSPGTASIDELVVGIENGVAIHDVIGMHTANPITGDFSVGASGYRIRDGKKAEAIRGFAISGNLHNIFLLVERIGADLKFYGSVGAPSVRIAELSVGGQ